MKIDRKEGERDRGRHAAKVLMNGTGTRNAGQNLQYMWHMLGQLDQQAPRCPVYCILYCTMKYNGLKWFKSKIILTPRHLCWTASDGCQGTLRSFVGSNLSSVAGSEPRPRVCQEQTLALSGTGCLSLASWKRWKKQVWYRSCPKPLLFRKWTKTCVPYWIQYTQSQAFHSQVKY